MNPISSCTASKLKAAHIKNDHFNNSCKDKDTFHTDNNAVHAVLQLCWQLRGTDIDVVLLLYVKKEKRKENQKF